MGRNESNEIVPYVHKKLKMKSKTGKIVEKEEKVWFCYVERKRNFQ